MAEYIERDKMLAKIARMINYAETNGMGRELTVLFQVGDAVMDCPAFDVVEVKHGRWVVGNDKLCHCSECKTLGSPQWKGCPVCLARMGGD